MKVLLVAINAKYIHSNLAVYSLQKYALEKKKVKHNILIKEYTINQFETDILRDIYLEKADLVVFSCYIWNIEYVRRIAGELKTVACNTKIWVGGPEVSYDAREVLEKYPFIDLVICGEGEETFSKLLLGEEKEQISGIVYRKEENMEIIENPQQKCMDMDEIPFVYDDLKKFEHKILYYETSRGCPFSCSYCLSSIDKTVRFRSFSLVKKELQFFLDNKVKQVKFVDRTFNCKKKHAMDIWTYLRENDNGITNFHFEVSADLFDEEELALLSTLRPGLIQLEIGVQSTNAKTIEAIRRKMDLEKLEKNVMKIHEIKNMHQHLDLIAGLPYEDYETFKKSFDDIYRMKPQQLQLGFLKVLKGSYMHEMAKDYGLVYQSNPVYEVYHTKWISYDEILELKAVEEMVEVYYNSNQFFYSLSYLQREYDRPFQLFKDLADYYEKEKLRDRNHNRIARYEILMQFAFEKWGEERQDFKEILLYDLYLRENLKSRPEWATDISKYKKMYLNFFKSEEKVCSYLKVEGEYDSKKAARKYHIEPFSVDIPSLCLRGERIEKKQYILFDYDAKSPLTGEAKAIEVDMDNC
ncbi:MAG: B12-binding domain-containing radical SAM protein [Lachnospiraceae bacterium]